MSCLILYALIAAMVCGFVSLVELLDRYAHTADFSSLIFNLPAGIYVAMNLLVGVAAVYVSSATGVVDFHLNGVEGFSVNVALKAIGIGFCSLGILRSNFVTLTGEQKDIPLGPNAILEKLKEYLDVKINANQKTKIDGVIKEIMNEVDPYKARNDLPALCLTGNRCTQKEIAGLKETIDNLLDPRNNLDPFTRGMMMGHALYKLFGVEVLRSSVQQLEDIIRIDRTALEDVRKKEDALNSELINARGKLSKEE